MLHGRAPGAPASVRSTDASRFRRMAVHCRRIDTCDAKTRAELVDGLGRGIGATAAHELGHQAGLGFSHDARCDDCYDGDASTSYAHFFAAKHWSGAALAQMQRTLPGRRAPIEKREIRD